MSQPDYQRLLQYNVHADTDDECLRLADFYEECGFWGRGVVLRGLIEYQSERINRQVAYRLDWSYTVNVSAYYSVGGYTCYVAALNKFTAYLDISRRTYDYQWHAVNRMKSEFAPLIHSVEFCELMLDELAKRWLEEKWSRDMFRFRRS